MELSILFLRSSILGESNNLGVSGQEKTITYYDTSKRKTTGIQ